MAAPGSTKVLAIEPALIAHTTSHPSTSYLFGDVKRETLLAVNLLRRILTGTQY